MNHPLGPEFPAIYGEYRTTIRKESDRGAVLVSATILDSSLEEVIKLRLLDTVSSADKLFSGFSAPLSSFAAKIEIAFRLGIIAEETMDMLTVFRKLRNDCAHRVEYGSFDEQRMKDRLNDVFLRQPQVFEAIKESITQAAAETLDELDVEMTVDDFIVNHWPIRKTFDVFFATTAAAIAGLVHTVERIPSRI